MERSVLLALPAVFARPATGSLLIEGRPAARGGKCGIRMLSRTVTLLRLLVIFLFPAAASNRTSEPSPGWTRIPGMDGEQKTNMITSLDGLLLRRDAGDRWANPQHHSRRVQPLRCRRKSHEFMGKILVVHCGRTCHGPARRTVMDDFTGANAVVAARQKTLVKPWHADASRGPNRRTTPPAAHRNMKRNSDALPARRPTTCQGSESYRRAGVSQRPGLRRCTPGNSVQHAARHRSIRASPQTR